MKYMAVIFDLDGTLTDSLADLADATNHALVKFGLPEKSLTQYKKMIGNGLRIMISRAMEDVNPEILDDVIAEMKRKYRQICLNKTKLYKGIQETIAQLKDQRVKLAVLTNKDQDMAKKIITHFFTEDVFDKIVGTTGSEPPKPGTAAVKAIAESFGLANDQFLFVGDSSVDMDTAVAAGITAVGVSWGFRDVTELTAHGADKIIYQPNEILAFFN